MSFNFAKINVSTVEYLAIIVFTKIFRNMLFALSKYAFLF